MIFGKISQGALDGSVPHPGLYSQNASYPEDYIIEDNNVFGNHRYAVVLREEVSDDVIMVGNSWGTGNLARITEALFDGRKDESLGKVLFPPFAEDPFWQPGQLAPLAQSWQEGTKHLKVGFYEKG